MSEKFKESKYKIVITKEINEPSVNDLVTELIHLVNKDIVNFKIVENYLLFTPNMDYAFNKYGLSMSLVIDFLEKYQVLCGYGSQLLFAGVIELQKY